MAIDWKKLRYTSLFKVAVTETTHDSYQERLCDLYSKAVHDQYEPEYVRMTREQIKAWGHLVPDDSFLVEINDDWELELEIKIFQSRGFEDEIEEIDEYAFWEEVNYFPEERLDDYFEDRELDAQWAMLEPRYLRRRRRERSEAAHKRQINRMKHVLEMTERKGRLYSKEDATLLDKGSVFKYSFDQIFNLVGCLVPMSELTAADIAKKRKKHIATWQAAKKIWSGRQKKYDNRRRDNKRNDVEEGINDCLTDPCDIQEIDEYLIGCDPEDKNYFDDYEEEVAMVIASKQRRISELQSYIEPEDTKEEKWLNGSFNNSLRIDIARLEQEIKDIRSGIFLF